MLEQKKRRKPRSGKYKLKDKRKFKRRLLLLCCILLLLLIGKAVATNAYDFVLSKTAKTVAVTEGTLESDITVESLVIRDERVIKAPIAGVIQYLGKEGERVRVNTPIALVIDAGKKAETDRQLAEIERKLERINNSYDEQITNLKNQVETLNFQVRSKAEEIAQSSKGFETNTASNGADLQALLTQRQKLVAKLNEANKSLAQQKQPLTGEKAKLTEYCQQSSHKINAPVAGIVSFQFDGLEDEFTLAGLKDLSIERINNAQFTNNILVDGIEVQKGHPILKVINNVECALVFTVPKGIGVELSKQKDVKYHLDGETSEKQHTGKISFTKQQGDSMLIAVKDTSLSEVLTGQRKVIIDLINAKYTGLIIPKSAIIKRNGKTGAFIVSDQMAHFKPVKVKLDDKANGSCGVEGLGEGWKVIKDPSHIKEGQKIGW